MSSIPRIHTAGENQILFSCTLDSDACQNGGQWVKVLAAKLDNLNSTSRVYSQTHKTNKC